MSCSMSEPFRCVCLCHLFETGLFFVPAPRRKRGAWRNNEQAKFAELNDKKCSNTWSRQTPILTVNRKWAHLSPH